MDVGPKLQRHDRWRGRPPCLRLHIREGQWLAGNGRVVGRALRFLARRGDPYQMRLWGWLRGRPGAGAPTRAQACMALRRLQGMDRQECWVASRERVQPVQ